jgi:hypothetical protein
VSICELAESFAFARATTDVRFGPIADIRRCLFDHIVSSQKNAVWYGNAKRFRGLEIDY